MYCFTLYCDNCALWKSCMYSTHAQFYFYLVNDKIWSTNQLKCFDSATNIRFFKKKFAKQNKICIVKPYLITWFSTFPDCLPHYYKEFTTGVTGKQTMLSSKCHLLLYLIFEKVRVCFTHVLHFFVHCSLSPHVISLTLPMYITFPRFYF